jgi:hypothetical protein
VIKKTKLNLKLTESTLNNIEIFNIFCEDEEFVPYWCTNDIMETFIKNCRKNVGDDII